MAEVDSIRKGAGRAETWVVACCALVASLAAVAWSWTHHALTNYGDAVAHMHIARRVFDSHQPRLSQLGSVWLPLPHLLMLPFVQVYAWWASGAAAIVPSAAAYVLSVVAMYRLARRFMTQAAAALAVAFFALNPNLLYLQTTAMTEPLFLCEMVWVALWLVEWREALGADTDAGSNRARRLLVAIALGLAAAVYTRYDGWIMTAAAWTGIGVELLRRRQLRQWTYWLGTALLVAAPLAWFVYNQLAFGDWLEFQRGPYSAAAIERHTMTPGSGPPHPGWHNMGVSEIFFLKAALMDAVVVRWGVWLLVVAVLATLAAWLWRRHHGLGWALQLLWLPAPFYAYSVAYGSVPIFLPVWWPHSYYNTRYGMELLPALALGVGFAALPVLALVREYKPGAARWAVLLAALLVVANAAEIARSGPLTYVEGLKNIEAHRPYQQEIPPVLRRYLAVRPGATVLMETSVDPEIVALTGIPLRQTINEADLEVWDRALAHPAASAQLVLAFDGDAVDRAVKQHPEHLVAVEHFHCRWQPAGTLYLSTE